MYISVPLTLNYLFAYAYAEFIKFIKMKRKFMLVYIVYFVFHSILLWITRNLSKSNILFLTAQLRHNLTIERFLSPSYTGEFSFRQSINSRYSTFRPFWLIHNKRTSSDPDKVSWPLIIHIGRFKHVTECNWKLKTSCHFPMDDSP